MPNPRTLAPLALLLLLLGATLHAAAMPPAWAEHGRGGRGGDDTRSAEKGGATRTASTTSTSVEAASDGNATLTLVVNLTGGDGALTLNATGAGLPRNVTVATTNGTGSATFVARANETISVAPLVPAAWRLDGSACDRGAPGNLTLAANESATCWFDLTILGELALRLETLGGDATLRIATSGGAPLPPEVNLTSANGTALATFAGVPPEPQYALVAAAPDGWSLTAATCSSGDASNVSVPAGARVTCTFALARHNALVVRVRATGGDGAFAFNASGDGLPATFDVNTTGGAGEAVFHDLAPNATYALDALVPDGWRLDAQSCDRGEPANVTLGVNDTATCTFAFTKLARLVVAVGATGGDATFAFSATGPGVPAAFNLTTVNGSASIAFDALDPDANRTLALAVPEGWRLASATCGADAFRVPAGGERACAYNLTRLAGVRGVVFHDHDRNGSRDAPADEGLAGWTVFVDADGDGAPDAGEPSATTNATGAYALDGLAPGAHLVRLVVPDGWMAVAPANASRHVVLAAGAVADGESFAVAAVPAPGPRAEGAGIGFWRNWDRHQTYTKAQLDGWLAAIDAQSAWLMPAGYAADTTGMVQLIHDATAQCNKRFGHDACARLKLEAHHLALRLNLASGRVDGAATVDLAELEEAAAYLGLGASATVRQVVDAIEAKAGASPSRAHLLAMKDVAERAVGAA